MDLIIFDCDGVIVDSEIIACRIVARMIAEHVPAVDSEHLATTIFGNTDEEIIAGLEDEHGVVFPADFVQRAQRRVDDALLADLDPIPGIARALDAIAQPKAVVSNSPMQRVEMSLARAAVRHHFEDRVYSADQVERPKPAPDVYLFAAQRAGAVARHCIAIEDSVTGVTAAAAAGMRTIGFLGGSHITDGHGERLREAGALAVISSMTELPRLTRSQFLAL